MQIFSKPAPLFAIPPVNASVPWHNGNMTSTVKHIRIDNNRTGSKISSEKRLAMSRILFGGIVLFLSVFIGSIPNAFATTFPQFLDNLPSLPNGNYVYDYDISTENIDVLYAFYEKAYLKTTDPQVIGIQSQIHPNSLVKVGQDGKDAIWNDSDKDNLTYCIQKTGQYGFQDNTWRVASAMNSAAKDWENVANIDFKHLSSEDDHCINSDRVLFKVLKTWATWQGGNVRAAAFFPDDPPSNRTFWIAADMPDNTPDPLSFTGLLRHELGHVLGLVHEHARRDRCPASGWRALTGYDYYSVMHYRIDCDGPNADYFITKSDIEGIGQLYPFPVDPVPGPVDPVPVNIAPSARVSLSGRSYVQQPTLLDGTASNDPDGKIVSYLWSFGDGQSETTTTPVVEHTYMQVQAYRVTLRVKDSSGALSTDANININVEFNPALFPAIYSVL